MCVFFLLFFIVTFDSTPRAPKRICVHKFSFSKFKFVAIFQSIYADLQQQQQRRRTHTPTSLGSYSPSSARGYQDTDFSSQYLTQRHRFDLPSSSSSFGASAYMSLNPQSMVGSNANNAGTNLIVNYLPQDMTDRELYSLFRHSGPIESCRVMRDYKVRQTNKFIGIYSNWNWEHICRVQKRLLCLELYRTIDKKNVKYQPITSTGRRLKHSFRCLRV